MSYTKEYPSPDGAFRVVTNDSEMRMSHWISSAALWSGERMLVEVGDSLWSADSIEWSPDGRSVLLSIRRYPGDAPSVEVRLFPHDATAELRAQDGESTVPFSGLSAALEVIYRRTRRP